MLVLHYAGVTQGSVENTPSYVLQSFEYSSGFQYARAWMYKGCKYAKVTHGYV